MLTLSTKVKFYLFINSVDIITSHDIFEIAIVIKACPKQDLLKTNIAKKHFLNKTLITNHNLKEKSTEGGSGIN